MNKIVNISIDHPFGLAIKSEKLSKFLFESEIEPTEELSEDIWLFKTKTYSFLHSSKEEDIFYLDFDLQNNLLEPSTPKDLIEDIIFELNL